MKKDSTLLKLPELRISTPAPAVKLKVACWPAICERMPAESSSWWCCRSMVWPGLRSCDMNKWLLAAKLEMLGRWNTPPAQESRFRLFHLLLAMVCLVEKAGSGCRWSCCSASWQIHLLF